MPTVWPIPPPVAIPVPERVTGWWPIYHRSFGLDVPTSLLIAGMAGPLGIQPFELSAAISLTMGGKGWSKGAFGLSVPATFAPRGVLVPRGNITLNVAVSRTFVGVGFSPFIETNTARTNQPVPAGAKGCWVTLIGGGGGGGASTGGNAVTGCGGAGGGGGGCVQRGYLARSQLGSTYSVTVGVGAQSAGYAGTASQFISGSIQLLANGGGQGQNGSSGGATGGAGGTASQSSALGFTCVTGGQGGSQGAQAVGGAGQSVNGAAGGGGGGGGAALLAGRAGGPGGSNTQAGGGGGGAAGSNPGVGGTNAGGGGGGGGNGAYTGGGGGGGNGGTPGGGGGGLGSGQSVLTGSGGAGLTIIEWV